MTQDPRSENIIQEIPEAYEKAVGLNARLDAAVLNIEVALRATGASPTVEAKLGSQVIAADVQEEPVTVDEIEPEEGEIVPVTEVTARRAVEEAFDVAA